MNLAEVESHLKNDDNWGISRFKFSDLASPVLAIHFVALTNLDNLGDGDLPPTNHWSIFLEVAARRSVKIDCAPNAAGQPGMIILEEEDVGVVADQAKCVTIEPCKTSIVGGVLRVLIEKGRDHYIFTRNMEGCRYWMSIVAGDLAEAELISRGDAERVIETLPCYWPSPVGTSPVPRDIEEGQFF